jgi:phosphatidylserine/phosphatidylglycerophosphate/cardiolipin synthase-like enzyme
VVDKARTFITSANFTEAAHQRNIELGAVINDVPWARAVVRQFDDLVARHLVRAVAI